MKLLIAVPSLDYMNTETVKSLTALIMRLKNEGVDFDLQIESGTLVYMARDRLACRAINDGFTHVLWLDADMVFNDSVLEDLQFSGKPFVSGIAHGRRKPFISCLFKNTDLNHLERFTEYPKNTFEVEGCGFACVLIEVSILREVQMTYKTCFTPIRAYGEDLSFCLRAKQLGYKIYAEPTVRLGHIGHITIYPEDYERAKAEISNYGEVSK